MRARRVIIRKVGNSHGVVIPKSILEQVGLDSKSGAEMTIEGSALVSRRPASQPRAGRTADAGEDELVMGEFSNSEDAELVW